MYSKYYLLSIALASHIILYTSLCNAYLFLLHRDELTHVALSALLPALEGK